MSVTSSMRIGLLFEYGTLNGGERSMLAAIDQLKGEDCQFVGIAPAPSPLAAEIDRRSLPFEPLNLRDTAGKRLSPAELSDQLRGVAKRHDLDLLHANSLTMGRHLGAISPQLSVPTSTHVRDIMSLSKASVRDLNQHQGLFAVSTATRTFHVRQGVDPRKILTVYNGIDCEFFQPQNRQWTLHRELGVADDVLFAATIGQICLRKAQVDFAEAAARLRDRCPSLHYLIVGERHSSKSESLAFDQRISEVFAQAGIEHRLHRLGYCPDIHSLLREVDLLVHPARQEPLGRVLLEAAACGVPIVATDVGGTAEILTHGHSGLLVPPAAPEQLAEAMEVMINEPVLRERCGQNARLQVCEKFDIRSSSEALATAWQQVLSRSPD